MGTQLVLTELDRMGSRRAAGSRDAAPGAGDHRICPDLHAGGQNRSGWIGSGHRPQAGRVPPAGGLEAGRCRNAVRVAEIVVGQESVVGSHAPVPQSASRGPLPR